MGVQVVEGALRVHLGRRKEWGGGGESSVGADRSSDLEVTEVTEPCWSIS